MCALLRLVREIKVMYAEKMKMEILRREKKCLDPTHKEKRWQLLSAWWKAHTTGVSRALAVGI